MSRPATRNHFTPAWNTNLVSGDLIPTSWEDLADPKYDVILSLEVGGDYDWYMTLYGHYQEQGMADDADIDRLFADMVQGSKVAKGHSGQVELLSAGEFGVVAASYTYLTEKAFLGDAVDHIVRVGQGSIRVRGNPAVSIEPGTEVFLATDPSKVTLVPVG